MPTTAPILPQIAISPSKGVFSEPGKSIPGIRYVIGAGPKPANRNMNEYVNIRNKQHSSFENSFITASRMNAPDMRIKPCN